MFQVELIPWADTFPDFWVVFSVLLAVISEFTQEFDNGIIWDHLGLLGGLKCMELKQIWISLDVKI